MKYLGLKYFHLIWAGLWRKRARTLFTMASIVVAFLLFGLLQGLNTGFNTVVTNLNVDRLYVSAKTNMTDGLPISYGERIRKVPGVRAVSHWTYFGGYYQNARKAIPAFATDPRSNTAGRSAIAFLWAPRSGPRSRAAAPGCSTSSARSTRRRTARASRPSTSTRIISRRIVRSAATSRTTTW
jgi:hypothetical protein